MICHGLRSRMVVMLFAIILVQFATYTSISAQAANTVNVYILTTGDIHEHSQYLARIASYIKYMKRIHQNVVAIDCGDHLTDYATDDPYNGDLWKLKTRGHVMHRAMASMGYDVCVVGNHDECYGIAHLATLMNKWKVQYMGVNIVKSPAYLPLIAPTVSSYPHVSIGAVGAISTHTWHLPAADKPLFAVSGVRDGQVTSAINGIKGNADIVILLTHETDEDDRESADYLRGINVIAGGHSHSTIYEYNSTQHTSIVKSGFMGRYVSQLEIVWDWQNKAIVSSQRQLVDMESQKYEDHVVKALLRNPLVKKNDYDGDGKSELAVYNPPSKVLRALPASGGEEHSWSMPCGGDCVPVQGDFDGDGKSDPAVYDRASGAWTVLLSGSGYAAATLMLGGEGCVPMPGDYDGDLSTDCAVYMAAYASIVVKPSAGSERLIVPIGGGPGYVPAQGYYDGDGKADPVVYREEDGNWDGLMSDSSYTRQATQFGGGGKKSAPGYYDQDGPVDPTVYDESSGLWTVTLSDADYEPICFNFGGPGWTVLPADYDGDGMEDPALYREENGTWALLLSGSGYEESTLTLGEPGWVPVR